MSLLERTLMLDRRWIFLFVGAAVALPLFLKLEQKIPITREVTGVFTAIESLPAGSRVLLACDYDPGSAAEVQPMTVTFMKQALSRGLKVVIMGLWPQGPQQADLAVREALRDPRVANRNPQYGVDYVNLGFQSGNEVVIQRMGSNIPAVFPRDRRGRPIDQFPIMKGVTNFSSFSYVFNVSAGYPGTVEWVQFAGDRFHARIGSGSTAVQAPQIYPFFPGQITGILGGMKGAAEYEEITGFEGNGTRFMLSQSFAHIVVVLFIVVGNLAFFISRRSRRTRREASSA
jgi:hypothetical protein